MEATLSVLKKIRSCPQIQLSPTHITEDRGQRTENRGQRTENREQRIEDKRQEIEDRGQRIEDEL